VKSLAQTIANITKDFNHEIKALKFAFWKGSPTILPWRVD